MAQGKETARDVLNRLRWGSGRDDLAGVTITILHRGAPGDRKRVDGEEVVRLGRGSFETAGATIPYHRVLGISRAGRIMFQRKEGIEGP